MYQRPYPWPSYSSRLVSDGLKNLYNLTVTRR